MWKLSNFKIRWHLSISIAVLKVKYKRKLTWNCQEKTKKSYMTVNSVHGLEGSHQLNIVIYLGNDLAGLQIVCQRHADYLSTVSRFAFAFWYWSFIVLV